jgi:small redox-active disulfide protein 2
MKNLSPKIQVFGAGCFSCKRLLELTRKATAELGLLSEVEYVEDFKKMMEMEIMSLPAIAINNKPIMTGQVPEIAKIKELILTNMNHQSDKINNNFEQGGCSCGGKC